MTYQYADGVGGLWCMWTLVDVQLLEGDNLRLCFQGIG